MTQDLLDVLIYGAITMRDDNESPMEAVCKMFKMKVVNEIESHGLCVTTSTWRIINQLYNE